MLPMQMSTKGIVRLLKEQRPQKAPGPDCINATISKNMRRTGCATCTTIFQKSSDTGELPLDWQRANVSPILKSGNRSEPASYRPVSSTSIPCKMLEHIIHNNIMRHLEKYKILSNEQHGFRRGRSCETQLALSVNDLANVLDTQSQTYVVIMDLSRAYDLVPRQRLPSKNSVACASEGSCITGYKHY